MMTGETEDLNEILVGLGLPQKKISPRFFYDERGSRLFEQICETPEYYVTRTEIGILREKAGEMAQAIGPRANVIEFGIGSGLKTQLLLEALNRPVAFAPVDISAEHLAATVEELARIFPDIEMLPIAADFTRPFPLREPAIHPQRNLVYFPGSTIGNFEAPQAVELLRVMHEEAGENGCLLIGIDLKKDPYIIVNAYNDSHGITAKFNLNLLRHLNREFAANFDLHEFRHRAIYDEEAGRIEMHLVSKSKQIVQIGEHEFVFSAGEHILTEYSHKYSQEEFVKMAEMAGFELDRYWVDDNNWFSTLLFRSAD